MKVKHAILFSAVLLLSFLWCYSITNNIKSLIVAFFFIIFILLGFFLLKLVLSDARVVKFENIGLAFGAFFFIISLTGVPSLLLHIAFTTYFSILSVLLALSCLIGIYLLCITVSKRVKPGAGLSFGDQTPKEQVNRATRLTAESSVFIVLVLIDFIVISSRFRGHEFSNTDRYLFAFVLAINVAVVLFIALRRKGSTTDLFIIDYQNKVIPYALLFLIILATWVISYMATCNKYLDADDCTYISSALNMRYSADINYYESSLGCGLRQFIYYRVATWDLFIAYLSRISSIPPVELMQYLLYPILYIMAISSYYYLFYRIFNNRMDALLACLLLLIFNFKSNDYHTALSNFFMLRLHQPKSIVNFIFVPLVIGSLMDFMRTRNYRMLIVFLMLATAIVSIHPFGFYQVMIPSFVMFLIWYNSDLKINKAIATLIALIAVIVIAYYMLKSGLNFTALISAENIATRLNRFYMSPSKLVFITFLPLFAYYCRDRLNFAYLFGTSVILLIIYYFKVSYPLFTMLGGLVSWRFIEFIVPYYIILIWIVILLGKQIYGSMNSIPALSGRAGLRELLSVILILLLTCGFYYSSSSAYATTDVTRISNYSRIPLAEREVLEYVIKNRNHQGKTPISALFPDNLAWIAPTTISNLRTPVSRPMIVQGSYTNNNRWLEGQLILRIYNDFYKGTISPNFWKWLRNEFNFDIIVIDRGSGAGKAIKTLIGDTYSLRYQNLKYDLFGKIAAHDRFGK